MTPQPGERPRARGNAAERILAAAAESVGTLGAAQVSLQTVADAAGVSKALIHYHFKDRDELLVAVIDEIGRGLAERERGAIDAERSALAVDALWNWLEDELRRGEIRAVLTLIEHPRDIVRDAARRVATDRRAAAADTVARLFETLGLQPRVPAPLLADVVVAFVDGLALDSGDESRSPRVAFDIFWLAMLNLAE
jgi:AcrR family transcriptional regulator